MVGIRIVWLSTCTAISNVLQSKCQAPDIYANQNRSAPEMYGYKHVRLSKCTAFDYSLELGEFSTLK